MIYVKYTKITCPVSISMKLHVFHKLHKHCGRHLHVHAKPKIQAVVPRETAKQLRFHSGQITAIRPGGILNIFNIQVIEFYRLVNEHLEMRRWTGNTKAT